jgi:Zn-dependent protease with chaperone function
VLAVTWLSRAWAFLKAAPWLLIGITLAAALLRSARSSERKADAAARKARGEMDQIATAEERRRYLADQRSAINRTLAHADAAQSARHQATQVADMLETDGHPSVAELVRRWNRDQE